MAYPGSTFREHLSLFLNERVWRFNNPKPQVQLKQLKQWVKEQLR